MTKLADRDAFSDPNLLRSPGHVLHFSATFGVEESPSVHSKLDSANFSRKGCPEKRSPSVVWQGQTRRYEFYKKEEA
jgi:hypothetical protein